MAACRVIGAPAMPKGLRHGFGVNAFQSNVPPHLVQRWMGHPSACGDGSICFSRRLVGTFVGTGGSTSC